MIKSRMYAALSATNEAILRTRAPEELYQRVCDAVVHGGGFMTAGAMLADEDGWLRSVAIAGYRGKVPLTTIRISVKADSDRGNGLAGTAFRTGQSAVSNDYRTDFMNDERFRAFREDDQQTQYRAAAAVPILKGGATIGVFLFYSDEAYSLNRDTVTLLERLVENVSFALGNFESEAERKRAERANRRVSDMFAALSATNTAILRARNVDEMLQLVCDSVTKGGRSLGAAAIFMKQPDNPLLKLAAISGGGEIAIIARLQMSTDPDDPRGQGLHGPALRERVLQISYDVTTDPRTAPWVDKDTPVHGCAAAPLTRHGESVGVMLFFFGRTSGRKDAGIRQLMSDIAENVSFGLAQFEREDQQQRLSRMFSALSATNEAIMRAKSREELYQMVCEAAVKGAKFTSTTIFLAEPGQDYFSLAATAGPNIGIIQSRRYSPRADFPEGRGLTGTAFRSGKPRVSNDTRASEKANQWPYPVEQRSSKAGAALPLFSQKGIAGVLLFMAAEKGAFTDEFVELLQRLAENVSYALETFDRADEQRAAEKRIEYLATHDSLTGLPNRVQFNLLLEQSIHSAKRTGSRFAVLFIDLDRFKVINDSLGHTAGDTLLVEIAGRVKSCLRECDVVARLGGDEFVVILNDIDDRAAVEAVGRKILASLLPSLQLAGHECRTTGSIGIALYPDNGADAHTLTRNADIAMYVAKEDGKNDLRFFSSDNKSQSIERLKLEAHLRRALELDQFVLHYQPKLQVATEVINGVEALLRWNHPELGSLSPLKFIPLAEETGLIIPIGRWVLRTACTQNMAWQRQGLPAITMAVNLSPRQFTDENFLSDLDVVLRETAMPPHLLQLEITESMVMQNVERGVKVLDAIQSRGVRLAIDDFGTGYSSMSLMKQFPIDTIKIDRSFVRDIAEDEQDRAITTAIIAMGKALGLTVVAEGVETKEQDLFLRRRQCDELQGYLFSRPVPADQIPPLLTPQIASPSIQPRRVVENREVANSEVAR